MEELNQYAANLRRPSILIRAARHGLLRYNRNRDLKRLMQAMEVPPPEDAVRTLLDAEAEAERRRAEGDASYSLTRHIDLLIALLGEFRLLRVGESRA